MRSLSSTKHVIISSILAFSTVGLAGCGDGGAPSESVAEAEQAFTVCAKGATVEGIDVSVWQGAVNWQAVKDSGIAFGIARVSYGTSVDSWFDDNWNGMKSVGLVRGAYQFWLPDQDPIAQADVMIAAIGKLGPGDLPPVVDVEDTGGLGAATVASRLGQWIAHVESATGKKPLIYTGKYFWQDNVQSSNFGDYPLWIPNYSFDCPNLPDNYWSDWAFFQYTDQGSVPGVSGNVDRDKFNGTLADLQAFANSGPAYAAKFVSQSFPYASAGPVQIPAGGTLEATIELQNVGTKAWDENTMLGATEPRDRTSVFAGPEWPAPNRFARVIGTVAPGETYKFTFTLHAPAELGVYDEFFGVVEEGVAWFSDAGQGGPPDAQLEGLFEVVAGNGGGTGGAGGAGAGVGGAGVGGSTGAWGEQPADPNGTHVSASCSCSVPGGEPRNEKWPAIGIFVALGAIAARRRRS